MSIKSRVRQLEGAVGGTDWDALCPDDCQPERWEAIGARLRTAPPEAFHPWRDYADVLRWLYEMRPASLLGCPDPVLLVFIDEGPVDGRGGDGRPFWQVSDAELEAIAQGAGAEPAALSADAHQGDGDDGGGGNAPPAPFGSG